ncbi:T9SS type A sorting domain-containing protein [Flavobacteriales bacterium]|nr:T9SS type A sorting domain-containing protein [Flavobacteriales bacterium]
MKVLYTLLILLAPIVGFGQAPISHTIYASPYNVFSPFDLTVNLGDTIYFENLTNHNAVEVSEDTYDNNGIESNGGFELYSDNYIVLDEVGTHYYVCTPHVQMGMKGKITVQNMTSLPINPCEIDLALQVNDWPNQALYIYPDTIENLPIAQAETYYETNLQIKTPSEVGEFTGYPYLVDIGFPFPLDFSSFEIDSIQIIEALGLPEGMSLYSSNDNFTFMGDALGCLTLYGNTTSEMIGVHEITFVINVWVTLSPIGAVSLDDIAINEFEEITGYKLIVESAIIEGCTDIQACNYVENANIDNGNCIYPSSSMTNVEICEDEFIWNDDLYSQSGTYQYITSNSSGCDSIAILVLELNENSSSITNVAICEDEFIWNNDLYSQSGTYQYTTSNSSGCDSIAILELEIFSIPESQVIIGQNETTPFSTLTYALINNSSNYQWNISNGNILNNNGSSVEIIWGEDGIGFIEVIETNSNDCSTIHTLQVSLGNNTLNSWNCVNDACVDPLDGTGEYNSEEECQQECIIINDSWNCVNDACVEPMDGTGEYGSLNDCEANCSVVVEDSWNCVEDACTDPMDGSGVYGSLNDCEVNCSVVIEDSWNCVNEACIDPMDGTGIYSSLNDCEQECQSVLSIYENDFNVNIYPNPSSKIFNLEFYSETESEILVTNILGEQVYFESIQSVGQFKTQINLSDYSKGIYNLTIKTSDGISNHKLILK